MQLDGPEQSMQFSISPRRRAATPRRTCRLAWTSGETSGRFDEGHALFEPLFGLREFPFVHVQKCERPRQGYRFDRLLKVRGRIEFELLELRSQVGDAPTTDSPHRFAQLLERIMVVHGSRVGECRARDVAVELAFLGVDPGVRPRRIRVWECLFVSRCILGCHSLACGRGTRDWFSSRPIRRTRRRRLRRSPDNKGQRPEFERQRARDSLRCV